MKNCRKSRKTLFLGADRRERRDWVGVLPPSLLAVWHFAGYLTSLCFHSFLIWNMGDSNGTHSWELGEVLQFLISFLLFFFLLFRAAPVAYGSFLARGQIRATAARTTTAIRDLSHICNLHHSWILNPLSEARDWTHILMDASWARYPEA